MTHRDEEPPVWETGGTSKSATTKEAEFHYPTGLRRRRAASYRLPVLDSGRADPWFYDRPEPSERTADGYCAAAKHLIAAGFLPAPDLGSMRIMWRRDPEQRELVRHIAERWGMAA